MSRPRKRPQDVLSEVLPFRVTKEEADRIHTCALREGLSVNKLLRKYLKDLIRID